MEDRQKYFARKLRADPTNAGRMPWPRLRHDIVLAGSHFRRQAPIGPFIVDFASRKATLVIELDGGQHGWQREADAKRTAYIESRGYRVLRFWKHDVLQNVDGVLQVIQSVVTPIPLAGKDWGWRCRGQKPICSNQRQPQITHTARGSA